MVWSVDHCLPVVMLCAMGKGSGELIAMPLLTAYCLDMAPCLHGWVGQAWM